MHLHFAISEGALVIQGEETSHNSPCIYPAELSPFLVMEQLLPFPPGRGEPTLVSPFLSPATPFFHHYCYTVYSDCFER